MNKHIFSYYDFIKENQSDTSGGDFLTMLNQIVMDQINKEADAISATNAIRDFISSHMEDISMKMTDPAFVKSFYEALSPWYDVYQKELDKSEIDYFIGKRDMDSQSDEDIPLDNTDDEIDDFEFEI